MKNKDKTLKLDDDSYLNRSTPEGLTGAKRKAWYDKHGWEYDDTIEVTE